MENIVSVLTKSKNILKKSNIPSASLDCELLLSSSLNISREHLFMNHTQKINEVQLKEFYNLLDRRKKKEPIAYILNKKEFWNNSFYVNKNVLIPRPDTEILIEQILKNYSKNDALSVLDIGTGSGCIVLSLLKLFKNFKGVAIDISKKALNVAKYNAKMHQLDNRVKFFKSSVDNFFKGKYDLIVSNPPYINNKSLKYLDEGIFKYEPNVALEGGDDGLSLITKVILKSSKLLKKGGKLVLEIGFDQKYKVIRLLKSEKYYVNKIIYDYAKNPRCVISTKL